jgi:predicted kinase
VELGESVVLDASWLDPAWRSEAGRVAAETASDLVQLRCEVPADEAAGRLRRRAIAGGDASDATPGIAEVMRMTAAPWPEGLPVSTASPPEAVVAQMVALLDP